MGDSVLIKSMHYSIVAIILIELNKNVFMSALVWTKVCFLQYLAYDRLSSAILGHSFE